jgi:conjugative transposon TraM protein
MKSNDQDKPINSAKFLRKRKMMLILPLLVLPFITMAFWALGGGKGNTDKNAITATTGLNTKLPESSLKDDKNVDKLSYYDKADTDSLKRKELLRSDPYYRDSIETKSGANIGQAYYFNNGSAANGAMKTSPYDKTADASEEKIYRKIAELNHQINQPEVHERSNKNSNAESSTNTEPTEQFSKEVDRLEDMMQQMSGNKEADPEMQQLNGTLEKILDIQHPERIKEKIARQSTESKETVFPVDAAPLRATVGLLDTAKKPRLVAGTNGFYGVNDIDGSSTEHNAIDAVVHENQTLVSGSVVKLRLLNDIFINGQLIPKDNFIFGEASLNNERLEISIHSIRNEQNLFTVKLEVYDLDGLPGLYIPGAISRDVVKQSAGNALQSSLSLGSLDPSFGAQAATAGIETAKNLLSKKVRLIKVQVKAGYKILLKDSNQGNN